MLDDPHFPAAHAPLTGVLGYHPCTSFPQHSIRTSEQPLHIFRAGPCPRLVHSHADFRVPKPMRFRHICDHREGAFHSNISYYRPRPLHLSYCTFNPCTGSQVRAGYTCLYDTVKWNKWAAQSRHDISWKHCRQYAAKYCVWCCEAESQSWYGGDSRTRNAGPVASVSYIWYLKLVGQYHSCSWNLCL